MCERQLETVGKAESVAVGLGEDIIVGPYRVGTFLPCGFSKVAKTFLQVDKIKKIFNFVCLVWVPKINRLFKNILTVIN